MAWHGMALRMEHRLYVVKMPRHSLSVLVQVYKWCTTAACTRWLLADGGGMETSGKIDGMHEY